MSRNKFKTSNWIIVFIVILLIALITLFRVPILEKIGSNLVYRSDLVPSDAIVVLAGSHSGNRIKEAVRIFKKGMGKVIIFSGYTLYPGMDSHVGMKQYAIRLGVPEDKIIAEKANGETSTRGEAYVNLKQLEHLKAESFILVTSSFHTRRSHWVYKREIKKLGMEIILRVQPAPDPRAPIDSWWKIRSGKIQILLEYIKTFYYFFAY